MSNHLRINLIGLITMLILMACQPPPEEPTLLVSLVSDGRERTFQYRTPVTVDEFLSDAEVELDENDRVNPQPFTQITDGMRVTVVRVTEQTECEQEEIAYERQLVPNEGIPSGEERLAQAGQNGLQEICFRVVIEDGVPGDRIRVGQPTTISEPQDEVIWIGPTTDLEPVPVTGTLAYINNENVWIIQGSSTAKRPLTSDGRLDSLVFSLSADGQTLLYTGESIGDEPFFNQLRMLDTAGDALPILLAPSDVLYAEWVPQQPDTISYSTGEPRDSTPPWKALNNLWVMQIDTVTGRATNVSQILDESSGGLYGWWGTWFSWSPDGQKLAWVRADSVGLVDLETGDLNPLLEYAVFNTSQPWSWRSTVSWSWDSQLIATTTHGLPLGSEPPENSAVFNVSVADINQTFSGTVLDSAGMWSSPRFSPEIVIPQSEFPGGFLAYLRAREPYNSINGEYDLIVADRDGSNARRIFPESQQPGITTSNFGLVAQSFTWSPDGLQIAFIYQGNLWIIDVESAVAHQLTFDGGASNPVWAQ